MLSTTNATINKRYQQQMLARMWVKRKPHALLVGM
jgi:hypothetical protein